MHLIPIGLDVFYGIWFFFFSFFLISRSFVIVKRKMILFQFNLLHRVDGIDMMFFFFLFLLPSSLLVTRCLYVHMGPR